MAGSRNPKQPLLSLEQLLQQWGKALPHPKFDPEHAVSYRTWLAIANYVAYHDPLLLNGLFQGVEFPESHLDEGTIHFPQSIEEVMLAETKVKYAHLKLNPRHYGSIQTRLRLFENVVQVMGDPRANFRVGRNIRVMPEIGPLKLTFQSTLKGLLKMVGVNPAIILQARVPEANRALNKFLDTKVVQYGPDFMDVRVEYLRAEDVSAEGDHYTLGTITAGLEAIGAYKKIRLRALQTPLNEEQEMNKANLCEPGVEYIFRGYFYKPDVPVFLYRYYFQEQLGLLTRMVRAFHGIIREKLPSRLTREELREEEKNRALLTQDKELDLRAWREYKARMETAEARAATAEAQAAKEEAQRREAEEKARVMEARLILERQVSGANEVFGHIATLAHHNKNLATIQLDRTIRFLEEIFVQYPEYKATLPSGIFQLTELLLSSIDQVIATPASPETVRSAAVYVREALPRLQELIENERKMMQGGSPIDIKECRYAEIMEYVIGQVAPTHPSVSIRWKKQDFPVHVDKYLLQTALLNLVSNAVEASEPKSIIDKGIVEIQERQVHCGPEAGGRIITIIELLQSGYLSEEHAEKLNHLEKFTTKETGNGTGAVASYRIINAHNSGTIVYTPLEARPLEAGDVSLQSTLYQARIKITFGYVPE